MAEMSAYSKGFKQATIGCDEKISTMQAEIDDLKLFREKQHDLIAIAYSHLLHAGKVPDKILYRMNEILS